MAICPQSVVPDLIEDECNGIQSSTNCVILPIGITYLNLPANSTATVVIEALLASLVDARAKINFLELQAENFDSRITALENA